MAVVNPAQRMAQVANRGNRLQENFGQHHGRSHVQIHAAIVQVSDVGTQQAKIVMRSGADGRPIGGRMRVRSVGSHRHVYGDGRRSAVSLQHQAERRISRVGRGFQAPAQRFADSQPVAHAFGDGAIHLAAGFFRRSEAAVRQRRLHVLAGVPGQRDFEIVNGRGAIQREDRGVAAPHQVDQHRRQSALDDVAAQAPDDGASSGARGGDGIGHCRGGLSPPGCAAANRATSPCRIPWRTATRSLQS